jgi:hypothetical protein
VNLGGVILCVFSGWFRIFLSLVWMEEMSVYQRQPTWEEDGLFFGSVQVHLYRFVVLITSRTSILIRADIIAKYGSDSSLAPFI